jgi:hypothetical protein
MMLHVHSNFSLIVQQYNKCLELYFGLHPDEGSSYARGNIISMASIYLQPSVHAIHNPPCQYRESPALNSTQFKHSTPEKEIAISSSTLFKIP